MNRKEEYFIALRKESSIRDAQACIVSLMDDDLLDNDDNWMDIQEPSYLGIYKGTENDAKTKAACCACTDPENIQLWDIQELIQKIKNAPKRPDSLEIGSHVTIGPGCEYEGLHAVIYGITDGSGEGTFVHCRLDTPLYPHEKEQVVKKFEELYGKSLCENSILDEEIILELPKDSVVPNCEDTPPLAPDNIWILQCDICIGGEQDTSIEAYLTEASARHAMRSRVEERLNGGCLGRWKKEKGFVQLSNRDSYTAYIEYDYSGYHLVLSVCETKLKA